MKVATIILISSLLVSVEAGYIKTFKKPSGSKGLLQVPLIGRSSQLKTVRLHTSDDATLQVEIGPPFIAWMSLGTPEQKFLISFDTAVSDFWIQSKKCYTCMNGRYDNSKSSSYQKNGTSVKGSLFDATAEGFLSTDDLSLGGQTISNQTFAEITSFKDLFHMRGYYVDGFFGLDFKEFGLHGPTPPMKNMLQQGLIDHEIVSFYQKKENPYDDLASGAVLLGGVDTTKFTGNITYTPVLFTMWSFEVGQISFDVAGHKINGCSDSGCLAILDSAWPFAKGPKKYIRALNEAIGAKEILPGSDIYQMPDCDLSGLPDLKFTVSDRVFSIKPQDYVLATYDDKTGQKKCLSGLNGQDMKDDGTLWVLGAPFIGTSYTVLDFENKRIGFATLK